MRRHPSLMRAPCKHQTVASEGADGKVLMAFGSGSPASVASVDSRTGPL